MSVFVCKRHFDDNVRYDVIST